MSHCLWDHFFWNVFFWDARARTHTHAHPCAVNFMNNVGRKRQNFGSFCYLLLGLKWSRSIFFTGALPHVQETFPKCYSLDLLRLYFACICGFGAFWRSKDLRRIWRFRALGSDQEQPHVVTESQELCFLWKPKGRELG